jgi:CRISPR system Cascade subunit CasB
MTTRAFVARTVSRIQAGYVRRPQDPKARAALAQLRRGLGRDVGEVPEILEYTVNPDAPRPRSDEATHDERAIHVAMTLYGLHQQAQPQPMHVPHVGFGEALGRLRYAGGSENPGVVRRFQALGTATDLGELVHHARTLVTLLRGAGQGFDYGAFAEDLAEYQDPRRVDRVRLRWGRGFYRVAAPDQTPSIASEENR